MSSATAPNQPSSVPRPARKPQPPLPSVLKLVLRVQAAVLGARSRPEAARALVETLAASMQLDQVAVAFMRGGRLQDLMVSSGGAADAGSADSRRLLAAMHEAWDQRASLLTPPRPDEAPPRIRAAQRKALQGAAGSLACVMLPAASVEPGRPKAGPAGVLCALQRNGGQHVLDALDLAALDHVAAFVAPVLLLQQDRERQWRWRLARLLGLGPHAPARTRHMRRAAALAGAAALAALLAWPAPSHVGGRARVEGALQRTLVAPAAGYLRQVHVRPGDRVTQGQLLVELADEDLLLERDRGLGQLEQLDSALAEATAKADRTQVMLTLAKAAQAQAQLELVQSQLARAQVGAPFDAVVVRGDLTQRLGAPLEQGAELMTLAPAGQFRVIVEVDEQHIAQVAVGQAGSLALSALPWDTLALRVARITPMATAVEGRNVFEVEAELVDPPSADLRPGLAGSGRFHVGQRPWGAALALQALHGLRLQWWSWWG
jgi:multidrug efflux pump subunit AcrA (membrane-fusion protein)